MSRSAEIEQRALALIEQLLDLPTDEAAQEKLLASEPQEVRDRVTALKAVLIESEALLPTRFPDDPDQESAATSPPRQVGAFRLDRRIGAGGMGGVWLAGRSDGLYEQKVAVKFIRPGLVTLAGAAFRAERQILARLEHPNIARLIDGGVTPDGTPYLVMEYVDGLPIDEAIEGLALRDKVRIFIKAADAVQFAHSRLVVHADLKPSNIFVDRQGRAKLLDFGIARLIEGEGETSCTPLPMTAAYASPQRLAGAAPTTADDEYALGRILAEMVGDEDAELRAIAGKARASTGTDRYGSVAALIADLDRWQERLPVTAMPSTLGYRTRKFIARHRMGVTATIAAGLLLAIMAGIATRSAIMADRSNAEALARFDDARGAARLVSDELLGQLAERPGTFALRSRVVQAVQGYLDRLAASATARPQMRIEAAQGLLRLAEAQAKPGLPNLGLTEPAMANLDKALKLLEGLDNPETGPLTIRILLDRARLACFGRNNIGSALRDLEQVRRLLGPSNGRPEILRAHYYVELASAKEWNSEYPEAMKAARTGLALVPAGDRRNLVLLRSTALDLLAEGIYYHIDGRQSVAPYRQALAMLKDYAAKHPGDQIMLRRIARANWALGSTLSDHGNRHEAVAVLTDASRDARIIAQADPEDQDARRMLRISENARGQALAAAGQVDAGIAIIEANIAERRDWLDQKPGDPQRMRDYMVAIKAMGDLQIQYRRREDGCRTYGEARQLIALIRRRGQLTALDLSSVVKTLEQAATEYCGPAAH